MDVQVCPMERMGRLLVATDGSESSRSAVQEAIQLAKACSSKLIAMTPVLTNVENAMPWVIEREEKEMQEKLAHGKVYGSQRSHPKVECGVC
jgi:nucleotide-binding universal stress UspA family protein